MKQNILYVCYFMGFSHFLARGTLSVITDMERMRHDRTFELKSDLEKRIKEQEYQNKVFKQVLIKAFIWPIGIPIIVGGKIFTSLYT